MNRDIIDIKNVTLSMALGLKQKKCEKCIRWNFVEGPKWIFRGNCWHYRLPTE